MIAGELELTDLTPAELALVTHFRTVGGVGIKGPAPLVRANLFTQLAALDGPIGSTCGSWRTVTFDGFEFSETFDLSDRTLKHGLLFRNCTFQAPTSLNASRARLSGFTMDGCESAGVLLFDAAKFSSDFSISATWSRGPLVMHRAVVAGTVRVHRCYLEGMVADSSLIFDAGRFAQVFQVTDSMLAHNLSARHAHFGAKVLFADLTLLPSSALALDMSIFDTDFAIGPRIFTSQTIRTPGIKADFSVIFQGVHSTVAGAPSIFSERMRITGGLSIADSSLAGSIRMAGSTLERLEIRHSSVAADSAEMVVVEGDGLDIAADVRFGPDISLFGQTRIIGSRIGGQILIVESEGSRRRPIALNAEDVRVFSGVFIDEANPDSQIHLASANMGGLTFNVEKPPTISLVGAKFNYIRDPEGNAASAEAILGLLRRPLFGFSIAPYRQVSRWLTSEGDDAGSKRVSVAGERDSRREHGRVGQLFGLLLEWTIGYGYDPIRAVYWLIGLIAVASVTFSLMYDGSVLGLQLLPLPGTPGFHAVRSAPLFNPVTYAVSAIAPAGAAGLTVWSSATTASEVATLVFRVLGWILVAATVAGVANRVRRD